MAEWGQEKRKASKRREHIDCDQLIANGTWLSPKDQAQLTTAVKKYFTKERLNPSTAPSADEAWRFQGHMLLHLLNDDVIAVPRSELLGSLQRGLTCKFEKETFQWIFTMSGGKTKAPTILKLPVSSNAIMRAWLKFMRPVLVQQANHEYIFVHKNGSAPRLAFNAQVRALQCMYLGRSASPHAFRGMQVTASKEAGIGSDQHRALCWSRQHSTTTASKYYDRTSHKR